MAKIGIAAINFGEAEAEVDRRCIEQAFYTTGAWQMLQRAEQLPFVVGRKGAGKSAIVMRFMIEAESSGTEHVFSVIPSGSRHVEVRKLLSELVSDGASWQYIYSKVWEGILLGQIVRHITGLAGRQRYHGLSKELEDAMAAFQSRCGFYVNALDDALADVITDYVRGYKGTQKAVELVDLRKALEPYKWHSLIAAIAAEWEQVHPEWKTLLCCVDGLDENWEVSDPSLYFLAQLVQVSKNLSISLGRSVRFLVCLRDNMFRSLVDTRSIEYDKLEARICYLEWSSQQLFELVAKRAFPDENPNQQVRLLREMLPDLVDGWVTQDYIGQHVLHRPRDYINFFRLLQAECGKAPRASESHVKNTVARYCANRLMDLENEFGQTYPGITRVIGRLQSLPVVFDKSELLVELKEACGDSEVRKAAPELLMHYGEPLRLAHILVSIGVIGFYSAKNKSAQFVHEFSESRVALLFEETLHFSLHPVYAYAMRVGAVDGIGSGEIRYREMAALIQPSRYLPEVEDPRTVEPIDKKTERRREDLHVEYLGLAPGRDDSRKFETWVENTFATCFIHSLTNAERQIPAGEPLKKLEIVFDIIASHAPWEEIKVKYSTHRLLVECKNTENPSDDDINKLVRDMEALGVRVALLVYRSQRREPAGDIVKRLRAQHMNSGRSRVILGVTTAFLQQCLKKNEDSCNTAMRKLWRDHMERWLVG